MNQRVEKRDDGKEYQADQHGTSPADDIGDSPGQHFEEYACYCRNGHGETNGLRTYAEKMGSKLMAKLSRNHQDFEQCAGVYCG